MASPTDEFSPDNPLPSPTRPARALGFSSRGNASPAGQTRDEFAPFAGLGDPRADTAQIDDLERTRVRNEVDRQRQQKLAETTAFKQAESQKEADFRSRGVQFYKAPTGELTPVTDEQGRTQYHESPWKKTQTDGGWAQTRRNALGETESRAPTIKPSADLKDPNLYYHFPEGDEVAGHVDDLVNHPDHTIAATAAGFRQKRNAALRTESLKPLQDSFNAATADLDTAKVQKDQLDLQKAQLTTQVDALKSDPRFGQTQGGFLGVGAQPTADAQRLQTQHDQLQTQLADLNSKSAEIQNQIDPKQNGPLVAKANAAKLELDAWSHQSKIGELDDVATQRRVWLRKAGKPEQGDPVLDQLTQQQEAYGIKLSQVAQQKKQDDDRATAGQQSAAAIKLATPEDLAGENTSLSSEIEAYQKKQSDFDQASSDFKDALKKNAFASPDEARMKSAQLNEQRGDLIQTQAALSTRANNLNAAAKQIRKDAIRSAASELQQDAAAAETGDWRTRNAVGLHWNTTQGSGIWDQFRATQKKSGDALADLFTRGDPNKSLGQTLGETASHALNLVFAPASLMLNEIKGANVADLTQQQKYLQAKSLIRDFKGPAAEQVLRLTATYQDMLKQGKPLVAADRSALGNLGQRYTVSQLQSIHDFLSASDGKNFTAAQALVAKNEAAGAVFSLANLVNLISPSYYDYESSAADLRTPADLARFNALRGGIAELIQKKYPGTALAAQTGAMLAQFAITDGIGSALTKGAVSGAQKLATVSRAAASASELATSLAAKAGIKTVAQAGKAAGLGLMGAAQEYGENPNPDASFIDRTLGVVTNAAALTAMMKAGEKAGDAWARMVQPTTSWGNFAARQGASLAGQTAGMSAASLLQGAWQNQDFSQRSGEELMHNAAQVLGGQIFGLFFGEKGFGSGAIQTQRAFRGLAEAHAQASRELGNRLSDLYAYRKLAMGEQGEGDALSTHTDQSESRTAAKVLDLLGHARVGFVSNYAERSLADLPPVKGASLDETFRALVNRHAQVAFTGQLVEQMQHAIVDAHQALRQVEAIPDYTTISPEGQPITDPATQDANRSAAQALIRVALGGGDLTEAERQGISVVGQDLGTDMVREEKGQSIITDKARDWLGDQAPSAARLVQLSESQRVDQIHAQAAESARRTNGSAKNKTSQPPPAAGESVPPVEPTAPGPKSAGPADAGQKMASQESASVGFTDGSGQRVSVDVPADARVPSTNEPVRDQGTAERWIAETSHQPVRDVEFQPAKAAETNPAAPVEKPSAPAAAPETKPEISDLAKDAKIQPARLSRALATPMRERGLSDRAVVEASRALAGKVNGSIAAAAPLFGGRIRVEDAPSKSGGLYYDSNDDHLVVSLGDLARDHDALTQNPERINQIIREEAIHRAAVQLEKQGAWKADDLWNQLSPATQQAFEGAYNQGTSRARSPWNMGHEMVRMLVQGRLAVENGRLTVDGAAITEETVPPSVLERIRDLLARIRDYFTNLVGSLQRDGNRPETAAEVQRVVDLVSEHLKKLSPETAAAATPGPEKVLGDKISPEWSRFSDESKSLGIPRAEMPQIKSEHRGALTQFLKARGIDHTVEEVPPSSLKPTQSEYSPAKVLKARQFDGANRAILVSSDHHIIDGHHQWMAKLHDFPDQPMRVIRLNAPIREVLQQVAHFPSVEAAGGSKTGGAKDGLTGPASDVQIHPDGTLAPESRAALAKELGIAPEAIGRVEAITHKGKTVTAVNVLWSAEQANTSHDPQGRVSAGYPAELQPRDRSDKIYLEQQRKIAGNPNLAEEMLSGTPDRGTPIMAKIGDRVVTVIGNGRANAKALMYSLPDFEDTAAQFRNEVEQRAAQKGIDPTAASSVEQPVFARLILSPMTVEDLRRFSQESNQFSGASTNAVEQAKVDASRLTPAVLASFNPEFDIDSGKNDDFRREFVRGVLGGAENITPADLSRRISSALFAKAFGDTEAGTSAFARLQGEGDEGVRNLVRAMLDVAPVFAAMRQRIADGTLHPLDLAPALTRAVQDIAVALRDKSAKQSTDVALDGLVNQGELGGVGTRDAIDDQLLRFLVANRRNRADLLTGLNNFVSAAYAGGDPRTPDMFGATAPNTADVLTTALRTHAAEKLNDRLRSSPAVLGPDFEGDRQIAASGGTREFSLGAFRVTRSGGEDRRTVLPDVWRMYVQTYAKKGTQYKTSDSLLEPGTLFDLFHGADGSTVAFAVNKLTDYGYKRIASGTNRTPEGKAAWLAASVQLRVPGHYSELSDRPLEIAIADGLPMVPVSEVSAILGKPIAPANNDGYTYTRKISGLTKPGEKRMVGLPVLWKTAPQSPTVNSAPTTVAPSTRSPSSSSAPTSPPSSAPTSTRKGSPSSRATSTSEPLRSGQASFFDQLDEPTKEAAKDYARALPAAAKKNREVAKKQIAKDIPALAHNDAALGDIFGWAQEKNTLAAKPSAPAPQPRPEGAVVPPAAPPSDLPEKARQSSALADKIVGYLRADRPIDWKRLFQFGDEAFGGTQAAGKYNVKDAYDALELGINRYILDLGRRAMLASMEFDPHASAKVALASIGELKRILSRVPTQTKRTAEMDEFQQFSTVPPLAFAANWVADPRPGQVYLEPSAGVGGLAVFGQLAGAKVYANELSPRRAELLRALGGFQQVFTENAEQLNNVLPADLKADVIVMNPPFSATAGRMSGSRDTANAGVHLDQALKRLKPGGRLVAIVGEGMAADRPAFRAWWDKIRSQYAVRANVGVNGAEYAKYGTTYDNQLVVVDAAPPGSYGESITGRVEKVEDLIPLLESLRNERPQGSAAIQPAAGSNRPAQSARGTTRPDGGDVGATLPGLGENASVVPGGDRGEPAAQQPGVGGSLPAGTRPQAGGGDRGGLVDRPGAGDPEGLRVSKLPESAGGIESRQPVGGEKPAGRATVDYQRVEARHETGALGNSTFDSYQPRIVVPGSTMPPVKLNESAAMATVDPITPTYKLAIPREFIEPQPGEKEGRLSGVALESIILAGNAHQDFTPAAYTDEERATHTKRFGSEPPEKFRRGFFIGDGTGTGKGRQAFGVILDNWHQGRKQAVWVSEKSGLFHDARRDARDVAGMEDKIFEVRKTKASDKIPHSTGIAYTTYSTLRSAEGKPAPGKVARTRVDQLVEWLGKDFDGALIMDEAHNMANNAVQKGKRGMTTASSQALAGIELQRRLPNARVVYLSATGATEVSNLGYAERLGLWGPGTPFANKGDFIEKISAGGVAAMELVARDLKATGSYLARAISWEGVSYDRLEHAIEPHQRETYDALAEAWQHTLRNMDEALKVIGAVKTDPETGKDRTLDKDAKKNARAAFWGAHQRFFNQVITSMKMPTVLKGIRQHLADEKAVVVQLVNTNAASMERALAKNADEQGDLEDLDMSPRDQLIQLVQASFPVIQREEFLDEDGNRRSRPAKDSQGNPIINHEAVAMREALIDQLSSIRVPDGPLEMLLNELGKDNVAEVTGRTQRLVYTKDADGQTQRIVEARSEAHRDIEAKEFMDDKRRTLVFSNAGGTGRSFHADLKAKNQRPRVHVLLQPGWAASRAVQGFGRTHRNNQKQPPHYTLATTDIPGERRFMSSIARRLDQLGALTKGQRETGSQGIFSARDNLESREAHDALQSLYRDVMANAIPGVSLKDFTDQMGLKLTDDDGQPLQNLPDITKFLNRILSLKLDTQEKVFRAFADRLDRIVETAQRNGTLDQGMENLKALKTTVLGEQTIHRDPRTGAETKYVHLELTQPNERRPFESLNPENELWMNRETGKPFEAAGTTNRTLDDGRIVSEARMIGVTAQRAYIDAKWLDPRLAGSSRWQKLSGAEARAAWDKAYAAASETRTEKVHLLTGTLLNVWDRLPADTARVVRVQTDDGRRMIGRVVPPAKIGEVLENFGVKEGKAAANFAPAEVAERVIEDGATARLANGWRITRRLVSGEPRLELAGPELRNHAELDTAGVIRERIQFTTRYFIPTGEKAAEVIQNITATRPVVELNTPKDKLASGPAAPIADDEVTPEEMAHVDRALSDTTRGSRFRDNLPLADKIAAQFRIPGESPDTIRQEARIALLRAAERYEASKGPFAPFAGQIIRNGLRDVFNKEVRRVQREGLSLEAENAAGKTIGETTAAPDNTRADAESRETRDLLKQAIASLPPRARAIVEARAEGQTFEEIGARFGFSKQHAKATADTALSLIRQKLKRLGATSLEGGVLASAPANTETVDEQQIREMMADLARDLPHDTIAMNRMGADTERAGDRTVGRPDLANPAGPYDASRNVVHAVDESRKLRLERESHEQWRTAAVEAIAKDRAGVIREILSAAREGRALDDPIKVKAAQLLVNDLIQQAITSGDERTMREAQTLAWSYRDGGTQQARAFAARHDPFKKPADRYREFLAGSLFNPRSALKREIARAWTPAQKQREVDRLQKQLSDARAEVLAAKHATPAAEVPAETLRRISQLNTELGRAQQQKDRFELLHQGLAERQKKIEAELAKMGVSLDDIFNGEAYLRLRGARIDNNIFDAANYSAIKRRVLNLIKKGWSNDYIARKVGLGVDQVAVFEQEHIATLRDRLDKLGDAALDPNKLDALNLSSAPGNSSDLSPEERAKRIEQMIQAMGYGRTGQREQRTRRAPGTAARRTAPDKPTSPATEPGATPRYPATRGRTPDDFGNRQFGLGETGTEQPVTPEFPDATGRGAADDFAGADAAPPIFDISDPIQVAHVARAIHAMDSNGFDMLHEFWVNAVLSGPLTHAANAIGNTANAAWDYGFKRFGEATLNGLLSRIGQGSDQSPTFAEYRYLQQGINEALGRAWRTATRSYAAETSMFHHDMLNAQVEFPLGDAQVSRHAIPGKIGQAIRIPGNLMMAADDFFKVAIAHVEAGAQAYRIAKSEGLSGPALDARIRGLINLPGSDAWLAAAEKADELTYKDRHEGTVGGKVLDVLNKARREIPGVRYIIPFVLTPFNIFYQGFRMSPAGLGLLLGRFAQAGFYRIKDGRPIAETYAKPDQIKHVTEQLMAWAILALLYGAAPGDDDDEKKPILVTGSVPYRNAALGELNNRTGNTPNTIRIGHTQFNYGRVEPLATVIATTIDTISTIKEMRSRQRAFDVLGSAVGTLANQVDDKTFLHGISQLFDAARSEHKLSNYTANFLASFVPNLLRQPLTQLDPYVRDKGTGFGERLGAAIVPEASPRKVDVYGQEIPKGGLAAWRALVPVPIRTAPTVNRIDRLLTNWYDAHPDEAWSPMPLTRTVNIGRKQTLHLTGPQLHDYAVKSGQMASQILRGASLNIEHPAQPDLDRVRNAFTTARTIVRRQLFGATATEPAPAVAP